MMLADAAVMDTLAQTTRRLDRAASHEAPTERDRPRSLWSIARRVAALASSPRRLAAGLARNSTGGNPGFARQRC